MIPVEIITIISLLYFGLLFAVAYYADKKRQEGRSVISNANIYSLSLAVYLTSWTFYGSVGRAATNGLDFLPVYLGPTLIAFSWCFLLRKMVRAGVVEIRRPPDTQEQVVAPRDGRYRLSRGQGY